MCYSPINIINRSKTFIPGRKARINVPCGKCESCRSNKRNDWFVRAYYEYKRIVDNNGLVVFPTLTYRPNCLPVFDTLSEEQRFGEKLVNNSTRFSCFSKSDIVRFRKSLRKYFERRGVQIKFFITSEYGLQPNKTRRPHYHCLIFIPNFIGMDKDAILSQIQKAWPFGMVRYSDFGAFIQSYKGIRYACKYITKDINFYEKHEVLDYLFSSNITEEEKKRRFEVIKDYLPKHFQGQKFGFGLIYEILRSKDPYTYFTKGLNIGLDTETTFSVPGYFRDKLCYSLDDSGQRYLNDFGINLQSKLYDLKLQYNTVKYSHFFMQTNLAEFTRSLDIDDKKEFCKKYSLNSFKDVGSLVDTLLCGRSWSLVSVYAFSLKDRVVQSDIDISFINDMSYNDLADFAKGLHLTSLYDMPEDFTNFYDEDGYYLKCFRNYRNEFLNIPLPFQSFNKLPCFADFDLILDIYEHLNNLKSKAYFTKKAFEDKILEEFKVTYRNLR